MAPLLIPIAMELAKYAPSIIKTLTGSDKAEAVAEKVVDMAKAVTGASTGEEAVAVLGANPDKVLEFQVLMENNRADLEKAFLLDRADARNRDIEIRKAGGHNHRADIAVVGVVVGLVMCILVLVAFRERLPGEVVGIVSTVAGIFGSCLKDYFAFEFGSSRSSQNKDETITTLLRK